MHLFLSNVKKHLFKSSHNTLLHGRGQADETENLENLFATNSSQSFLYSKVRALFPNAELHWQVRTRVIWPGEFSSYISSSILSISFLIVGQTFWSLTHSPLWGPWSSLKWMTQWSERCVLSTCASCRETTRGECSRFCAKQHNCSREYKSLRTGGVPAHSKDLIYTAWTTPSRMSSASPKSGDVTLITVLSTVTVEIILNMLHLLSIILKTAFSPS